MPGAVKTRSGRQLTGPDIDRLTKRVEDGLDLASWKPRPGRPSLSETVGAHSPRIAVRLPEDLHRRAVERATREGRSMSEVVRDLLDDYAPRVPTSGNGRTASGEGG
jgi:predicted HicB family RNase H-like nuclease